MSQHDVLEGNSYAKQDEFTEMLEGMTKQELVKYARMTYNLSVNARYSKPELIGAIRDAAAKFKGNAQMQTGLDIEKSGLRPGYAEIQLHRTELTKGLRRVIVGLNGEMASLPIGVKFGCPIELVGVLNDAVRLEYEKNPETDELEERAVHAYPFTLHRVEPHTPQSEAASRRKRGFKGRPPREQWDEEYAEKLRQLAEWEKENDVYENYDE